jgi:malonate transporter and related proteins
MVPERKAAELRQPLWTHGCIAAWPIGAWLIAAWRIAWFATGLIPQMKAASHMSTILSNLAAVFLVIALGWLLRLTKVVPDEAWSGFERVTYLVLFPAVIIQTIAISKPGQTPFLAVALALVGAVLSVSVGLMLLRRPLERIGINGPDFTSVFQGAVRWNTFVALALASSLHGPTGVALMAVAIAAMVPLLNVLSVSVLSRHAGGKRLSPQAMLRAILLNPFVWSSLAGLALNPVSGLLPVTAVASLDIVGRASLAAGLLVVGSGLELKRLRRPGAATWLALILKLAAMPILAWALARGMGVSGMSLQIVVIAAAVPTATASYILSRQMGGNAPLMAEIITAQTILAMLTLPLAVLMLV